MNEPPSPEDPIWSRWRERHGRPSARTDRPAEETGNGAQHDEPAAAEGDRIRFGEPLRPGWDRPREAAGAEPHAHADRECLEWCPVCRTADVVRATVPPELRSQLESVQRDALVAMRAMLDHYIERLDGREQPPSRVEDIPIA